MWGSVLNATNSTVELYSGLGDGSFNAHGGMEIGAQPQALAIGDLNGDDLPDLVVVTYGDHGA